jgi:hypothetical protein
MCCTITKKKKQKRIKLRPCGHRRSWHDLRGSQPSPTPLPPLSHDPSNAMFSFNYIYSLRDAPPPLQNSARESESATALLVLVLFLLPNPIHPLAAAAAAASCVACSCPETMGSLAAEKTVTGWAARDASGHLTPYNYTLRYDMI